MFPFEKLCRFYGLEDVNRPAGFSTCTCVGGSGSEAQCSIRLIGQVRNRRSKIPDLIVQKNSTARLSDNASDYDAQKNEIRACR